MIRSRFVVSSLALLGGALVPARVRAQSMSSPVVTGEWAFQASGDAFTTGALHLHQQGAVVQGSAPFRGGIADLDGKYANHAFSGTWRAKNNETGWLSLYFTADGQGFSGEWGFHGRQPNGLVTGTRKSG